MYYKLKFLFSNHILSWHRFLWHYFNFPTMFFGIVFIFALDSVNNRLLGSRSSYFNQFVFLSKKDVMNDKQAIVSATEKLVFNDGTAFYLKTFLGNNNITKALKASMKIFCIINSSKKEILNRAQHIHKTWAKRCDKHVFLSKKHENLNLPFIDLKVPETRSQLWNKIRAALKWAYDTELNNFDFFLRADDDSYYVMENLRFMLLPFNPNEALYFGAKLKVGVPKGYMSGGAGVILTREALKRVVPYLYYKICPQPETSVNDDLELGMCAQNLNITGVDTRDHLGRHRMLPWSPRDHLLNGLEAHHFAYLYYPYKQDQQFDCCAEHMISFHYVYSEMLYMMELLIYHTKLIGIVDNQWLNILNSNFSSNLSIQERLKVASINIFQNLNIKNTYLN